MPRLRINPLLGKELRIRMRSWRTFGMISLYLLVLGGFAVLFLVANIGSFAYGFTPLAEVGRNLFTFLAIAQFVIVILLVPGLVGNAISGEKERQTLDLLTCTQLSPFGIVSGKLMATLSTVVLLIFASLPLYGLVFFLGGVSPLEVLLLFLVILAVALLTGCWSLMFSALLRRTVTAVVASYGLTGFMLGGSSILILLLAGIFGDKLSSGYIIILAANPLSHLGWIFPSFFRDITSLLDSNLLGLELWHLALLVQGGIAALSLYLATRRVNPLKGGRYKG